MGKNKYDLSVIIPIRNTKAYNRLPKRLDDILHSLQNQTIASKIEAVVSDIDSNPEFQKQHKAICEKYKAKYVYTETGKPWNISRARNIGIKNAEGEYVMVTDVDIVLAPNFMETALKYASPKTIVHCRLSDLPEDYDGSLDDIQKMIAVHTLLRPRHCYGGCQIVSKDWAYKMHGYDEEYETWGADDTDFFYRATQDGLRNVWIEGETSYFHQWHSQENRSENFTQLSKNRQRCKQTQAGELPVVRNPFGWGGEFTESQHPDTAIIITTFLRDGSLFDCVKSIRKYYPGIATYIADGGNHDQEKAEFLDKYNCIHIKLPFDTGVCGSRNEALKQIPSQYKYILICEDDIVFTPESRIDIWRKILDHDPSLGIIGGLMWRVQSNKTAIQHYEGLLDVDNDTVHISQIQDPHWIGIENIRCHYADIILNVFLMRREVHDDMQWDINIPQAPEHLDFFLSLKHWTKWKVGYTDKVQMNHVQLGYEGDYLYYRQRNQGFRHFCQKHKVRYVYSDWHKQFQTYPDKVDYMEWEMKQGSVMVDNLVKAVNILNRLKANWMLGNGTCLGAIRDKDFTRNADNLDVLLHPGHASLWDAIIKEFEDAGFSLYREWKYKAKKLVLTFEKFKMKVNVFFLFKKGLHIWHGYFAPGDNDKWDKSRVFIPYVFPETIFTDKKTISFKRLQCFVPDPPESYLEALYGQMWKVPDVNYKSWLDCKAIDRSFLKKNKIAIIPGTWDIIHSGYLGLIEKAKILNAKTIAGIMTDEAISKSCQQANFPFDQRRRLVESLKGIDQIVALNNENPGEDLKKLKIIPDYLICKDDETTIPGEEYMRKQYGKIVKVSMADIIAPKTNKQADIESLVPAKPENLHIKIYSNEPVAICIKTFLREKTFFRTLEAFKRNLPFAYKFYIADDGPISTQKAILYQELETSGHKIFRLPFDSGLSHGRNVMIKAVKEKYILLADDDVSPSNHETIKKMTRVLNSRNDIGIASGIIYQETGLPHEENRNFLVSEIYQRGLRFDFNQGMLFRYPSKKEYHKTQEGDVFLYADQVVNFFLAKKEIFKQVQWDDRIKIEWEHIDFFLALLKSGWKATVALDTKAIHAIPETEGNYNQYRRNAPAHYFLQKNGLYGVINRFQ